MTTYTFKVRVRTGVIEVPITASGYFAAEAAVKAMYPGCVILTYR